MSYAGYLLVPARGPRFFLRHLQQEPLRGLWLFNLMQGTLDRLESAHYDCFPSGHTELTILAWWSSRTSLEAALSGSILPTLCALFLLQFIFDTITRLTCWRELSSPWS